MDILIGNAEMSKSSRYHVAQNIVFHKIKSDFRSFYKILPKCNEGRIMHLKQIICVRARNQFEKLPINSNFSKITVNTIKEISSLNYFTFFSIFLVFETQDLYKAISINLSFDFLKVRKVSN